MKKLIFIFFLIFAQHAIANQFCPKDTVYPFTTDSTHFRIWNQSEYIPFFIKGVNMGVAVPGTFPGELSVSRSQYARWFSWIKEAGFNCIRLYTLHYPRFYEVLDSFNIANSSNPLYFFQGVWLEEELPNYNNDLYFLNASFTNEIEENVSCVHGNRTIAPRFGKAYGTYSADASKWNLGYIIGRETYPVEVLTTNQLHAADSIYSGSHLSIHGNPSETFFTAKLDHLIAYENQNYQTQRPVAYSSWPTLDPLKHPSEPFKDEDTASIDLNSIIQHNAPAGVFASYHAYPYYPDFIGKDSIYQTYQDYIGSNSYLGYLSDLKNHYNKIPLLISETGVPSSRGIAHYATNGMNHGGIDEQKQGETILRLFHNVKDAGCAGAIDFSFIDEWFKSTWITYPLDYDPNRRVLWHNIMSPEQNYGLIGFERPLIMQNWSTFQPSQAISKIDAAADYDYFRLNLHLGQSLQANDDLWIAFDTYDSNKGESLLPSGDTVQNRAEFALHINNYSAQLYVTQAYDIYGILQGNSTPAQLYHSVSTDGAPWFVQRWKANTAANLLQYVGNLSVQNNFAPVSSMNDITLFDDSIHIRLPWTLLYFVDPSSMRVLNDYRSTPTTEDTISDGIQITAFYHGQKVIPSSRFNWPTWNTATDVQEYKKTSYFVVKNGLDAFNTAAFAVSDTYIGVDSFPYATSALNGLLKNDFDLDGNNLQALLLGNAKHGTVSLSADGSFSYVANPGFVGQDYFEYCIFDGISLSKTAYVCLDVDNSIGYNELFAESLKPQIFPNPAVNFIKVKAQEVIQEITLFDAAGKLILTQTPVSQEATIDVSFLSAGSYFVKTNISNQTYLNRFVINK